MQDTFTIVTDSTSNLLQPYIDKYGIVVLPLKYLTEEGEYAGYTGKEGETFAPLYEKLRTGGTVTTSMVNTRETYDAVKKVVQEGKDVLYIGLSSKLSGTFYAVEQALKRLKGEYPERNLYAVDSFCVALGEGLLVYGAIRLKKQGKSLAEIYRWCGRCRFRVNTIFTVDDLKHLRRSGRASAVIAAVGTVLGIKPILRMSRGGVLQREANVRGRKRALNDMVDRVIQGIEEEQTVFVSHGDCREDAVYVANSLRKCPKVKKVILNMLDPVIGVHTGPGSIGIFYVEGK